MRRITGSVLTALAAVLASIATHTDARATASAESVRLFVTVMDAKGNAVAGLTKDDFSVRIDSRVQEVLGAEPATDPPSVLILTDRLGLNSTYTPFDVGETLNTFVRTIRKSTTDAKFAVTTFDGPVIRVAQFSSAIAITERALGRLATNADEAAVLDGLVDACRSMTTAPTPRRIIFTLVSAYKPDRSTVQPEAMGDVLRLSGASLWVVEARQAQGANYNNPVREQVLDAGSTLSGGMRDVIASRSGMNTATKRVAELVLAQYALTFGPGGGSARSEVTVEVKRPNVRVLAPRWLVK